MNKSQENKFSMYLYVEQTCIDYSKVWKGLPAFDNAFVQFRKVIKEIKKERQVQELKYTGLTKKRHDIKDDAIEMSILVISSLKAYALVKNDTELYNKIAYSKKDFTHSRDTILLDRCELVYNNALMQGSELAKYGVAQETLDEYHQKINKFKKAFCGSKKAISTKKMATQQIKCLLNDGDKLLKGQLDNLIVAF